MSLLFALLFLASLLALEGIFQLLQARRNANPDRVRERLTAIANRLQAPSIAETSAVRRPDSRPAWAEKLLRVLGEPRSLDLLLYRAGVPMSPVRFALISLLLGGLGWAVGSTLLLSPLLGSVGLLAGCIPWLSVRRTASKRMARFADSLPEALELVTRAMRAGHALGTGFQLVGEEMSDPIGYEFALVAEEMRFGLGLREALQNLGYRVENPDLPFFVTAVLVQRETGGNLAEILDNLSGLLRQRVQFHGKVRALTAQGRGAALFLALWLPLITAMLAWVSPEYLEPLLETGWGNMVLLGVGLLDVTAYLIARKIATVEV